MAENRAFKRVLLKISGEALKGKTENPGSIDSEAIANIAKQVSSLIHYDVEVAMVIGAGNLFRGVAGTKKGITRTTGDYMGMLATVMNGLALRDAFIAAGVDCLVQSALPVEGVVAAVDIRAADVALRAKNVVIFAGGTGHPFFTTDTTAALRACEIGADAVLKATKVDGVYSADPVLFPDAQRYEELSFEEALQKQLGVMDSTAFSLCRDNCIKIAVFNFWEENALSRVTQGDTGIATIVGAQKTEGEK